MQTGAMNFELDDDFEKVVSIKVVGVGGAGGNAVNRMIQAGVKNVEFISMNTDNHALYYSKATHKLQIGQRLTAGRGAGGNPEKGQKAAEESRDEIENALRGSQIVFITAGMGGGTGTGAAPVVAEIARGLGILTVGIVTKPFAFEGKMRMTNAMAGIEELQNHVDSLVIIPNERLREVSTEKITLANAFQIADDVLRQGVQSISDIINIPGMVNLDFADITAVMKDAGRAHMGVGSAKGENKAERAAEAAISSPLLETSINGAKGVIINLTASGDIDFDSVEVACSKVRDAAHPDANIIWGVVIDEQMDDELQLTVIATGFEEGNFRQPVGSASSATPAPAEDPFKIVLDMFD